MNKSLVAIGVLLLLAFAGGYYVQGITGNAISEQSYSYTKAVCNQGQCLDVYVECLGGKSVVTPITPYAIVNTSRFNITNEIDC